MLFLCRFFSYASMQQTLPLVVCFMLEVGGPSWCHRVQRAEPERGPLLAAGARVVPVLQIHRPRTGKWNGSGQKAQLTKLNRLACCCYILFRPNASFRTLTVSYVSGTNQNQDRRWKKHGAARKRKLVLTLPCAFFALKISKGNGFVATECTSEKKNSGVFFHFFRSPAGHM